MNATTKPRFQTTVDQDRGPHASGARYTQLTDVVTDFHDYLPHGRWAEMSQGDREWWAETLEDYHAARVALAELPMETRESVTRRLIDEDCGDMGAEAATIRRLIAEETED
jgi:hypothetical protein